MKYADLCAKSILGIEVFHLTMPAQRFLFLLRCLRFDDNPTRRQRLAKDKLAAIRVLFDMVVTRCQDLYTISEFASGRAAGGLQRAVRISAVSTPETKALWDQDIRACRCQDVLQPQNGGVCRNTTRRALQGMSFFSMLLLLLPVAEGLSR